MIFTAAYAICTNTISMIGFSPSNELYMPFIFNIVMILDFEIHKKIKEYEGVECV
jgi:hypothetical protein